MSQRSLTGYDNLDVVSDEPVQEVFRYDAVDDRLVCVSCNPSGARPVGLPNREATGASAIDPLELWPDETLAATLPEATQIGGLASGISLYRPRAVQDNGRIFFNAADALVPADSNGNWDVYQYEDTGSGSCSALSGDAALSRSAGGCVALMSSGSGVKESAFLDASIGGGDVFFLTSAALSVTDEDTVIDVYDARVDGIPAKLIPRTECLGETCQPPISPPNDPTPSSATFEGPGDLHRQARKRCPKAKRRVVRDGRTRCVSRKQKKGKQRSKRDNHERRTSR